MKRVKITEDGFVWKVLTKNEAKAVLDSGCFSLYALYEDDTEREITTYEELDTHLRHGEYVGMEVGFIDDKNN